MNQWLFASATSGIVRLISKLFGDDLLPVIIAFIIIALIVAALKKD